MIGDTHLDHRADPVGLHADLRARRREAERVLEQVEEHLLDHLDVDADGRQLEIDREADRVVVGQRPQAPHRGGREVSDVRDARLGLYATGTDARQVERLGHEPLEALGLVDDGVEHLAPVVGIELGVGGAERRRRGADRREGCTQVVAHRGQEAGSGLADLDCDARFTRLGFEP